MAKRSGSADLPLHSGHVPAWLHTRMARLGALISKPLCTTTGVMSSCADSRILFGSNRLAPLWAWIGIHLELRRVLLALLKGV